VKGTEDDSKEIKRRGKHKQHWNLALGKESKNTAPLYIVSKEF
jgi:hypothetical protein